MKEDFFDWLNNCPVTWFLINSVNGESRKYEFIDNDEEEEIKEEIII